MPSVDLLWKLISTKSTGDDLSPVDLVEIVPLAESHGVAPLLYLRFSKFDLPALRAANQILKTSYYQNVARNQVLQLEIQRLDAAFQAANLPYLPLKGAALAWTVYPDPALRPMYDLDLLVQPADLLAAVNLARAAGYRLDKLTNHAVLRGGPTSTVSLELHWCLPGAQPLPFDIVNVSKNWHCQLFETFTYLYCVAHLLRQHLDAPRLIWMYDLHLLRPRLDAAQLANLAGELGLSAELAAVDTDWFALKYSTRSNILEQTRSSLRLLPKTTRLRLLGALLFPSREYMLWRYRPQPEWLWPAWYVRRWIDIF